MKWINASKQSPEKGDLYHTKIVMKGTDLESFPSTNNFYSGEWEVDDDYEVVEWLYEGQEQPEDDIFEYWKNWFREQEEKTQQ